MKGVFASFTDSLQITGFELDSGVSRLETNRCHLVLLEGHQGSGDTESSFKNDYNRQGMTPTEYRAAGDEGIKF